jgi:hypothetical protein
MSWNDPEYFRERAAVEREMGQAATDPRVIAAHQELAQRYETLVAEGTRPKLLLAAQLETGRSAVAEDAELIRREA